ncbi:MAG: hypothetical protein KF915_20705 [Polyangiaceae bacterium]|nr:hypothetical protein [Polyangiaceae bacterium]
MTPWPHRSPPIRDAGHLGRERSPHRRYPPFSKLLACLGVWQVTYLGCAEGAPPPALEPPSYTRPGVALSRESCSCLACVTAGACEGRAPLARDEQDCVDGFSFEQSTRMEAVVTSCQPSCFQRTWSVPAEVPCARYQPDDCCPE